MEIIKSASVKLIPIKCPECKEAMKSRGQDIFFYCDLCHKGYEVSEEKLRNVDVQFMRIREKSGDSGRTIPFWVFSVKLGIKLREAQQDISGLFSDLAQFLTGVYVTREQGGYMKFYVPANSDPLEKIVETGKRFTLMQPELEPAQPCSFEELAYNSDDAAKLADYIFITSEIEKPDVLIKLNYELELKLPRLVVIRFD